MDEKNLLLNISFGPLTCFDEYEMKSSKICNYKNFGRKYFTSSLG